MKKLVCIGLLITLLVSCTSKTQTPVVNTGDRNIVYNGENQWNEIYKFNYCGDKFGERLSWFLEKHDNLSVVSISPCDEGVFGAAQSYTVILKKH